MREERSPRKWWEQIVDRFPEKVDEVTRERLRELQVRKEDDHFTALLDGKRRQIEFTTVNFRPAISWIDDEGNPRAIHPVDGLPRGLITGREIAEKTRWDG